MSFFHKKPSSSNTALGNQQEIDWELVAANGVEFAMIRVGYRGSTEGDIQPDD